MKKLGRNDPCLCGSGKKYKQSCLMSEGIPRNSDRSEAVPKAIQWLFTKYGQIAREALHEGFFGGLDDDEYATLQDLHGDSYGVLINKRLQSFIGFITDCKCESCGQNNDTIGLSTEIALLYEPLSGV